MNKLLLCLTCLVLSFGASAQLQTNTYTATLFQKKKTQTTGICAGYFYVGQATYLASQNVTNRYYIPDTNHLSVFCTNDSALIFASSTFGEFICGKGYINFVDTNYPDPNNKWVFTLCWSNNVPPPTNQLVPIQVFGVHTNAP